MAFVVAMLVEAGWVGIRAMTERSDASTDCLAGEPTNQIGKVLAPGGQAAGVNYGLMYQERGR
ncbi:hypothetical protein [Dactylosporangium darangshiense]|uniref:hypothetical protein n=1 Tax=Dactylosporangium darangshiense TaxID=579108 RepID=UPI0031E4EDAB